MNVCNKVLFSFENVSSIFYFPQNINLKQRRKKISKFFPKCLPFLTLSGEGPFIQFICMATAIHTDPVRLRAHIHHSVAGLPHPVLHRDLSREWNSWQRKNFNFFCSSKRPYFFFSIGNVGEAD